MTRPAIRATPLEPFLESFPAATIGISTTKSLFSERSYLGGLTRGLGWEGGGAWTGSLPYPQAPPYVSTVLPTIGSMDDPVAGYARNAFDVRCVGAGVPLSQEIAPPPHGCHRALGTFLLKGPGGTLIFMSGVRSPQPSTINPQPSTLK